METCAWLIAVWALNVYISSVTMSVCLRVQHSGGEVGGGGGGGPGGRAGSVQTGGQSPGPASLPAGGGRELPLLQSAIQLAGRNSSWGSVRLAEERLTPGRHRHLAGRPGGGLAVQGQADRQLEGGRPQPQGTAVTR